MNNIAWIYYARTYSLILIVLGFIGYTYNPDRAISALIMATGVGVLLNLSTYCLKSRIALYPLKAKRIYTTLILAYSLLVLWRACLASMAWLTGNDSKLFVSLLLSLISLFGLFTAWLMYSSCPQKGCEASHDCHREQKENLKEALFAAGCFWGVEKAFQSLKGVITTEVGYTGGWKDHPTYNEVCSDTTGHAEAVRVVYNASIITYGELLDFFWSIHDSSELNRQGPDIGTQYRSVVFYSSQDEQKLAESKKRAVSDRLRKDNKECVTQILERKIFWPAEQYHQNYLRNKK